MKAMILAAGLGKRLSPLTQQTPKPLLKVGKNSLIVDQLNKLAAIGIDDFVVNVSYLGQQLKDELAQHSQSFNIHVIEEPFPYGTGGGLINAMETLGDAPFILCNADIFSEIDYAHLLMETSHAHLIGVPNPPHNPEGDFSIENEKVIIQTGRNDLTWSGLSVLHPKIMQGYIDHQKPFDIWNTILKPLILESKVTGYTDSALWIDVGTIERLELARRSLKEEN